MPTNNAEPTPPADKMPWLEAPTHKALLKPDVPQTPPAIAAPVHVAAPIPALLQTPDTIDAEVDPTH